MATIRFTTHLGRHLHVGDMEVAADTLRAAVHAICTHQPGLKSYILDDQGALRKHVNIFVDSVLVQERVTLGTPIAPDSEIFIMQALSGG